MRNDDEIKAEIEEFQITPDVIVPDAIWPTIREMLAKLHEWDLLLDLAGNRVDARYRKEGIPIPSRYRKDDLPIQ